MHTGKYSVHLCMRTMLRTVKLTIIITDQTFSCCILVLHAYMAQPLCELCARVGVVCVCVQNRHSRQNYPASIGTNWPLKFCVVWIALYCAVILRRAWRRYSDDSRWLPRQGHEETALRLCQLLHVMV
ncbi:uncharacterized protein B0I36DRAFT_81091 [Microdochium trichocladiopsis]|uniref:Uncharacterized protein n=1 Tax=Microdochium trichocladiopsis TaxID=1682393 RepID=A0A9P8XNY1_9PEZI|nr:uncharacterized protein B0I36DRAFT_81091 [Microdochium trichocladiopsis]KAH7007842.1 hypothetical protein B0I36DRAFT_81091 [Microdochium trichocladiopsis]